MAATASSGSAVSGTIASVVPDADSWMSADEKRLAEGLIAAGQAHLFSRWESGHEEEKHAFMRQVSFVVSENSTEDARGAGGIAVGSWSADCVSQVAALEAGYPGGIAAYVGKARELLAASARGDNPFAAFKPEVRLAGRRVAWFCDVLCRCPRG
jgi:hypothetical protein